MRRSSRAASVSAWIEPVVQQHPVRQAGQRVVERLALVVDGLAAGAVQRDEREHQQRDAPRSENSAVMTTIGPSPSRMPTVEVCSSRSVRR